MRFLLNSASSHMGMNNPIKKNPYQPNPVLLRYFTYTIYNNSAIVPRTRLELVRPAGQGILRTTMAFATNRKISIV